MAADSHLTFASLREGIVRIKNYVSTYAYIYIYTYIYIYHIIFCIPDTGQDGDAWCVLPVQRADVLPRKAGPERC